MGKSIFKCNRIRSISGVTLLSTMMAVGIAGIAIVGVTKMAQLSNKANKATADSNDFQADRRSVGLTLSVDDNCKRTFKDVKFAQDPANIAKRKICPPNENCNNNAGGIPIRFVDGSALGTSTQFERPVYYLDNWKPEANAEPPGHVFSGDLYMTAARKTPPADHPELANLGSASYTGKISRVMFVLASAPTGPVTNCTLIGDEELDQGLPGDPGSNGNNGNNGTSIPGNPGDNGISIIGSPGDPGTPGSSPDQGIMYVETKTPDDNNSGDARYTCYPGNCTDKDGVTRDGLLVKCKEGFVAMGCYGGKQDYGAKKFADNESSIIHYYKDDKGTPSDLNDDITGCKLYYEGDPKVAKVSSKVSVQVTCLKRDVIIGLGQSPPNKTAQ